MKTLYIDINNAPISNTSEVEVLSIDLKGDFYYSLGEGVKGRVRGISSNIDLIADYMSSGEDATVINQAWEQVKEILFSDSPEEEVTIVLPQSYVDWLRYNNNEAYRNLYEQLYKGTSCISAVIDLAEIYEEAVGGTLFRQIKKRIEKDIEIEELVFNDNCVSRKSAIVRKLKDRFEDLGFVPFENWEGKVENRQPQVVKEEVKEKVTEKKEQEREEERLTAIVAGHRMVDLGLSVCWADCNVGANSPEEYGGYYAWGETEEKEEYVFKNYEFYEHYDEDEVDDDKVDRFADLGDICGSEYFDVARWIWGGNEWRMPTLSEFDELCQKCKWESEQYKNVRGFRVIGSNGNSIFLPAGGMQGGMLNYQNEYACYWTGISNKESEYYAYCLQLGYEDNSQTVCSWHRQLGLSVRPVIDKKK